MGYILMGVGFKWVDDVGMLYFLELLERYVFVLQGFLVEMIVDKWELLWHEFDELVLCLYQFVYWVIEEGCFECEMILFVVNGDMYVFDQGIWFDMMLEVFVGFKFVFKLDGKVMVGNLLQIFDGVVVVLLMLVDKVCLLGLMLWVWIVDQMMVGVDFVMMFMGLILVMQKLLVCNGMMIDDIDLFEVNEVFVLVVLVWSWEFKFDMDCVNVNGGVMAFGHLFGSIGVWLIMMLFYELECLDKEIGLVMMCCGGGFGMGIIIQCV